MNRKSLLTLTSFGLGLTVATAHAQTQNQPPLNFGGSVGIYFPSNRIVRDAFGTSIISYGVSPVSSDRPSSGSLSPHFDVQSASKNGNKLFIGAFTYGYEYHLGDDSGTTVPYVRGFGGASYFDYGIDQPGGRVSSKRLGYTYGAEVGIVFARRLRIAARYNVYSKENIFSFNGVTLDATYALFRL